MPLQRQNVPLVFQQGIDTKSDPKQVVAGKLQVLENATFQQPGQLTKRYGYTQLPSVLLDGSSLANGLGTAAFKDELTVADGLNLYSYSDLKDRLAPQGVYQPIDLTTTPIVDTQQAQTYVSSAFDPTSGLRAAVTGTDNLTLPGNVGIDIIDTVTGANIAHKLVIDMTGAGGPPMKILVVGNFFVFIYFSNALGTLVFRTISTAAPTVLSAATQIAAGVSPTVFDAVVILANGFVAYTNTAGTSIVVAQLSVVAGSVVATTSFTQAGAHATTAITTFGSGADELWVGYYDGSAVKVFRSNAPTNLGSPTTNSTGTLETLANVVNVTGVAPGGVATFYYEVKATLPYNHLVRRNTIVGFASTVGTPDDLLRSAGLASEAFSYVGQTYVLVLYASALQPTLFLLNTTQPGRAPVVARFAQGVAGTAILPATVFSGLPAVETLGAGVFVLPYFQISQSLTVGGTTPLTYVNTLGAWLVKFRFSPPVQTVEAANNLHLGGGFLWMYDGGGVYEQGFHVYPEAATLTKLGGAGFLSAGTYSYVLVYEWLDARGQLSRSAPSIPTQIVGVGANDSIVVHYPMLRLTQKANVHIVIYRTLAGGTTYYRVGPAAAPNVNDPTVDAGDYTDGTADTTIASQLQLYTTGGEVDNFPAPAPIAMCAYKARTIVLSAETPTSWWYSKEVLPELPLEFSSFFVQNESQTGGPFTACKQMDDKLVLFKETTVFYVTGEGPSPSGAANDFTQALQVVTETGCNNAKSVVLMPDGLMYQTPKGIYLLDRSLGDHYIGAAVEAYNAARVTSAVLVPHTTQVRFTLSTGVVLVYDYYVKDQQGLGQWSVFTGINAIDSAVFEGQFTYLTAAGLVMQETPGVFTDAGAFIQLRLKTSWLSFAQLQGYQRAYRFLILGDYRGTHQLQVDVAYDFVDTVMQTDLIPASAIAPYQYRINLARQKCEAVQLTIADVQASSFGQGVSLSGVTLEIGAKAGLRKMDAARSFG